MHMFWTLSRQRLAWDHATLITKITGRQPLTPAESEVIETEHIPG
jgi:hypothetical protein